jgi:hypothetical protein
MYINAYTGVFGTIVWKEAPNTGRGTGKMGVRRKQVVL